MVNCNGKTPERCQSSSILYQLIKGYLSAILTKYKLINDISVI
jgi:hypothetical protein